MPSLPNRAFAVVTTSEPQWTSTRSDWCLIERDKIKRLEMGKMVKFYGNRGLLLICGARNRSLYAPKTRRDPSRNVYLTNYLLTPYSCPPPPLSPHSDNFEFLVELILWELKKWQCHQLTGIRAASLGTGMEGTKMEDTGTWELKWRELNW